MEDMQTEAPAHDKRKSDQPHHLAKPHVDSNEFHKTQRAQAGKDRDYLDENVLRRAAELELGRLTVFANTLLLVNIGSILAGHSTPYISALQASLLIPYIPIAIRRFLVEKPQNLGKKEGRSWIDNPQLSTRFHTIRIRTPQLKEHGVSQNEQVIAFHLPQIRTIDGEEPEPSETLVAYYTQLLELSLTHAAEIARAKGIQSIAVSGKPIDGDDAIQARDVYQHPHIQTKEIEAPMMVIPVSDIEDTRRSLDPQLAFKKVVAALNDATLQVYVHAHEFETDDDKKAHQHEEIIRRIRVLLQSALALEPSREIGRAPMPVYKRDIHIVQTLLTNPNSGYRHIRIHDSDGNVRSVDLFKFLDMKDNDISIEDIINQAGNPYKRAQLAYLAEILFKKLPTRTTFADELTIDSFQRQLSDAKLELVRDDRLDPHRNRKRVKYPKRRLASNAIYSVLTAAAMALGTAAIANTIDESSVQKVAQHLPMMDDKESYGATEIVYHPDVEGSGGNVIVNTNLFPQDENPALAISLDGQPIPELTFSTSLGVDSRGNIEFMGDSTLSGTFDGHYRYSPEIQSSHAVEYKQTVPIGTQVETVIMIPSLTLDEDSYSYDMPESIDVTDQRGNPITFKLYFTTEGNVLYLVISKTQNLIHGHFVANVSSRYNRQPEDKDRQAHMRMTDNNSFKYYFPVDVPTSTSRAEFLTDPQVTTIMHLHPMLLEYKIDDQIRLYMHELNDPLVQSMAAPADECPTAFEAMTQLGKRPLSDETIIYASHYFAAHLGIPVSHIGHRSEPGDRTQHYVAHSNISVGLDGEIYIRPEDPANLVRLQLAQATLQDNYEENVRKLTEDAEQQSKNRDMLLKALALATAGASTWFGARELMRYIRKKELDIKTGSLLFAEILEPDERQVAYDFLNYVCFASSEQHFTPLSIKAPQEAHEVFVNLIQTLNFNRLKKYLKSPKKFEPNDMPPILKAKIRTLAGILIANKRLLA